MIKKYNYIAWLQANQLQPRTISEYTRLLDNLIANHPKFDQQNIEKFIANYKGNVVRSFLKSYKTYLSRNPKSIGITPEHTINIKLIDIPSFKNKKRKTPIVISKAEVIAMYKKMPSDEAELILLLSFFCGLRREEVLNLKVSMFNFKRWLDDITKMGLLTMVGKGNKEGIIPVNSKVMKKVYEFLGDNHKDRKLFPEMNPRRWSRVLSKAGRDALGRHIKPHTLRHSAAMYLRGEGFAIDEIKEFLRHEDISTTQIYSRVTPEQLMKRFEEL